ncbi:hypothetical protein BS78_05G011600 [Paspalum vaginatum]|nr:hypothetical protein BS78_05G011600 [Paspalum vaginatum]
MPGAGTRHRYARPLGEPRPRRRPQAVRRIGPHRQARLGSRCQPAPHRYLSRFKLRAPRLPLQPDAPCLPRQGDSRPSHLQHPRRRPLPRGLPGAQLCHLRSLSCSKVSVTARG